MKEQELVNVCLNILSAKKIFCWRNNTGAFKTERGGYYKFGAVGSPDIFACEGGQLIGIECKVGKNKQSDSQKAFQKAMEKAGAFYWLVYTPEDLLNKLNDYGL